jgi:hypothetical protein
MLPTRVLLGNRGAIKYEGTSGGPALIALGGGNFPRFGVQFLRFSKLCSIVQPHRRKNLGKHARRQRSRQRLGQRLSWTNPRLLTRIGTSCGCG